MQLDYILGGDVMTGSLMSIVAVSEIRSFLLRAFPRAAIALLRNPDHLVTLTSNCGQVVSCQLPPFFLHLASELVPALI